MTDATRFCPCCSQILPNERGVVVNLDHNTAVIDNYGVQLQRLEARLLALLAEIAPGTATDQQIRRRLYGDDHLARCERSHYAVIKRLRHKLVGTAYRVENVSCAGYRLARVAKRSAA